MKNVIKILESILDLIKSDYGFAFTDCGGDFQEEECCEGCKEYSICKGSLEKQEKYNKIKTELRLLKEKSHDV